MPLTARPWTKMYRAFGPCCFFGTVGVYPLYFRGKAWLHFFEGFSTARAVLERLRALMTAGRYRLTLHAEEEHDADEITIDDIEEAYSDAPGEIIEDYPDDPRGHSALVLAFTKAQDPLHASGRFTRIRPF